MFVEGETYSHPDYDNYMFVLAIESEEDGEIWLAILWIDPITKGQVDADEICIKEEDYDDWTKEELI